MIITTLLTSAACSDMFRSEELKEKAERENDAKLASEMKEEAFKLDKRSHKMARIGDVISFLGL